MDEFGRIVRALRTCAKMRWLVAHHIVTEPNLDGIREHMKEHGCGEQPDSGIKRD